MVLLLLFVSLNVYIRKSITVKEQSKQATENATNYSRQIDFLILSMLLEGQNRVKISLRRVCIGYLRLQLSATGSI